MVDRFNSTEDVERFGVVEVELSDGGKAYNVEGRIQQGRDFYLFRVAAADRLAAEGIAEALNDACWFDIEALEK